MAVADRPCRAPAVGRRRPRAVAGASGSAGSSGCGVFIGVLAIIVLAVSLTVLRPVVAGAVVDWATDNPSALHLPFVQDLVREDLGKAMTDAPSTEAGQAEFVVGRWRHRQPDRHAIGRDRDS